MFNLPLPETCEEQTLQYLQKVCCETGSPLRLDHELCWKRKLWLLHCAVVQPFGDAYVWSLPWLFYLGHDSSGASPPKLRANMHGLIGARGKLGLSMALCGPTGLH